MIASRSITSGRKERLIDQRERASQSGGSVYGVVSSLG